MFKGLGNLGNIASIMGQVQAMPEKLQELNDRMKGETVSASSGCSRVQIVMNGVGHVESVTISEGIEGHELEQAVLEATNAAGAAAKALYAESIRQMVADMDLNMPGIDKMLTNLTGGG